MGNCGRQIAVGYVASKQFLEGIIVRTGILGAEKYYLRR